MFRILMFLFLSLKVFAYINITPITFDERIDKDGGAKNYIISNSSKKIKRYRVYVEPVEEKNDMTNWVEWYPKSLSLKPGESKEIKVLITAPSDAKRGEYTTKLCVKELETPMHKENINILTNLKMELAGYVGDIEPKILVKEQIADKNKLRITIKNIGEIRQNFEIYTGDKEEDMTYLNHLRLFKGETKSVLVSKKDLKKIIVIKDQEKRVIWRK